MPVNIVKDGRTFTIPESQLTAALDQGFSLESNEEAVSRVGAERKADQNSGVVGSIAAGLAGVERGATLGLSDVYLAGQGYGDYVRDVREAHPTISTVGEVAGAIAPTLLSAGTATPTALAAKAGQAIAKGGAKGIGRAIAGGAVEGAAQGLGSGVSELALDEKPLTAEHIASTLSSNMLFGGLIGGAAGGVGRAAEKGLAKAKGALDEYVAAHGASTALPEDLAGIDAKGLRAAKDAELESLEKARVPQRQQFADDLASYRSAQKDEKIWLATKGSDDASIRTIGKQTLKADRQLDAILDNPKALAERPQKALEALQKQEHALEQLAGKDAEIRAAADRPSIPRSASEITDEEAVHTVRARDLEERGYFEPESGRAAENSTRMESARKAIKEGQRDPISVVVDNDGRVEVLAGRHRLAAAIEQDAPIKVRFYKAIATEDGTTVVGGEGTVLRGSGDGLPGTSGPSARVAALDKVPGALEQNRALQAKIRELTAPHASDRLTAIQDAHDALTTAGARKPSFAEQLLGGNIFGAASGLAGSIPVLGQIPGVAHMAGAKASKAVTDFVFGKLGNATAEAAKRTSAAVDKIMTATSKVAPVAPVIASRVLSSVRFAPEKDDERKAREKGEKTPSPKLAEAFKARADEIRAQTAPDETGTPRMKMDARQQLADRIGPLRAHDPVLADHVETVAARKMEFLASKLPKRPDFGTMQFGPDRWQPSDMEMRQFARYVAAAEDPGSVEDRVADGSLTPEDVEAYTAVYPERAADLTRRIIERLPELQATLPYKRRLALSMLSGVPVDPAMTPDIFARLQANFTAEPGTMGGMQAPRPAPAFGSVKKSAPQPTPAQERAG